MEPKKLTDRTNRDMARHVRDRQWRILERIAVCNPLWICWWNKNGHHARSAELPNDLEVCGLIDGNELVQWLNSHPDWTVIGDWSDERYAAPVRITDAGRAALADRAQFDMEPVDGGLVEPGWQAVPTPRKEEP